MSRIDERGAWAQRKYRTRWLCGDDGKTHPEKRLLAAVRASGWDVMPGLVRGVLVRRLLKPVQAEESLEWWQK